ncbi:MAG: peptide ABC transporter substrate-binding protein [Puniceicoccales bacterium]|nr:peptide ABC transporter substrate-binding protein [Puniceicoccales bacterium]
MLRPPKILLIAICCLSGCLQHRDSVLKIGSVVEPSTLDPQLTSSIQEAQIVSALFEGLLVPHGRTLEPLPAMARSYSTSTDGLEYTFFLRDDIFWSNEDPVIADDFLNAIKRGLSSSMASPWVELYFVLKNARPYYNGEIVDFSEVGVEVISPKILKFTLEQPTKFFPSLLTHWAWFPVNRRHIEQFGAFTDRNNRWTKLGNIVSNGPYLLASIEVGNKVVLKKNKRYWDAANVAIDQVHFISNVDATTEENMFVTQQLDITDNVPLDKIKFHREQGTLQNTISLGSNFYWFNCKKKPFDDVRVRKALSLAIDRNAIGILRNRGPGFEAYALVPPGTADYDHKKLFQSDIHRARQLLGEAGYANGKHFPEITLLYNTNDNLRIVGEAIQEMWRKNLNINVRLQSTEWGTFLVERRQHAFEICRGGWIGDFNDATTFLNLLLSKNNNNHSQWANKTYDCLMAEASRETITSKRSQILAEAEALMIDEMPIIPLYFDSFCHLVSSRIGGWYPNILDWHPLKGIFFK